MRTAFPGHRRSLYGAGVCTLLLALCAFPVPGGAEPILVHGRLSISSHGGDFPSIEEPVLELLFHFDRFVPPQGALDARAGEVLATSPLHGTIGGLQVTFPALPEPLEVGARFDLSATATWTNGTATDTFITECCVESLSYGSRGTLVFTAGVVTLLGHDDVLAADAPFTLHGTIAAFDRTTGLSVYEHEVAGAGTLSLTMYQPGDRFTYAYRVEPIPEPSTMILIGLGVAGLAARAGAARRSAKHAHDKHEAVLDVGP